MAFSDLQLALLGVGAAGVAAVWAYNKWQERKHRRLAERILHPASQADAVLGAAGDAAAARQEPGEWIEPGERAESGAPGAAAAPSSAAATGATGSPWADPEADAVARLEFAEAVPAPALWAAQAEWAGHLGKPLHWVARTAPEDGAWHLLSAHDAGRYSTVVAALQLADRRGPVSESELVTFAQGVRQLGTQLGGVATLAPVDELLGQARALDEFCAGVDVQLAINIVDPGGAAFAGTKLRGLAEAAGMQLGDDGRYHAPDEEGYTLYTLANMGVELLDSDTLRSLATHGITLSFDVPNVASGARVFDRMVAAARQFASGLGGVLVDAQRAPLTDAMIAGIRAKIEELQARMAARQIVAGSVRARRLFS